MDLNTVMNKLNAEKYPTIEECIEEIQLIWDNCFIYNAEMTVSSSLALTAVDP